MSAIRFLLCAVFLSSVFTASEMSSGAQPLTKPPKGDGWKSLFNGKNLDGWHLKVEPDEHNLQSWTAINGVLVNVPPSERGMHGVDLVSDVMLGSHELYIEFMVPKRSNSGVYLIGQYEVQVYDSYGKKNLAKSDCGGIYGKVAPSENASLPAGHWQSFHAIFHKAELENGNVTKEPCITVYHNGKKVIDNISIEGLTGAALIDKVVEKGPTYLQGNHGMVFYRNIFYKAL